MHHEAKEAFFFFNEFCFLTGLFQSVMASMLPSLPRGSTLFWSCGQRRRSTCCSRSCPTLLHTSLPGSSYNASYSGSDGDCHITSFHSYGDRKVNLGHHSTFCDELESNGNVRVGALPVRQQALFHVTFVSLIHIHIHTFPCVLWLPV